MIKNYLTPEAFKKLREELEYLKTVKRKEISQKLQETKELGDLSENAAYQEMKELQSALETRILELDLLLRNVAIIKKTVGNGKVEIGSTIEILSLNISRAKKTFTIVGSHEAMPSEGKISNESPLGKAFLGRKKGEVIVVKTPHGEVKYKVVNIK